MLRRTLKIVSIILILCFVNSVSFAQLPSNIKASDISKAKEYLKTPEGQKLLESPEAKEVIGDIKKEGQKTEAKGTAGQKAEEKLETPQKDLAEEKEGLSDVEAQFSRAGGGGGLASLAMISLGRQFLLLLRQKIFLLERNILSGLEILLPLLCGELARGFLRLRSRVTGQSSFPRQE